MRVFIAISIDEPIRRRLAKLLEGLRRDVPAVRWVNPQLMHLTIQFLGEVPDQEIKRVCDAAEQAALSCAPFDMAVRDCGCFPPRGQVRVVWAGLHCETDALQTTRDACQREFAKLGFPPENRPFQPHLTIGRVKFDSTGGAIRKRIEQASLDAGAQPVVQLEVMESQLGPKEPTYTCLATYPLGRDQAQSSI